MQKRKILEQRKWDAVPLRETWRQNKKKSGNQYVAINGYFRAGGFAHKNGVAILLNRRWRRKLIQTKYVSEPVITTTIKCDRRMIELTSVYFPHSGYADMHIEKMDKNIETHCDNKKNLVSSRATSTLNSDLVKILNCDHVEENPTNGVWMKQWLMNSELCG